MIRDVEGVTYYLHIEWGLACYSFGNGDIFLRGEEEEGRKFLGNREKVPQKIVLQKHITRVPVRAVFSGVAHPFFYWRGG